MLREHPNCFAIDRTPSPRRAITRISTACSWVSIDGTKKADQGSQFSSHDWQDFLKAHHLEASMSRRGNCHDNAVAESFFQLLKRERVRRKIYADREAARRDIFAYIEMFYNPRRRHGYNQQQAQATVERLYFERLASV